AWGFQQGVAYVSALLDWPVQVQRLTGLALLIGLPIALVLAWYDGDRGQRQVTHTELAILTLFLLGGGIFWHVQRTSETATGFDQRKVQPARQDAGIVGRRLTTLLEAVSSRVRNSRARDK